MFMFWSKRTVLTRRLLKAKVRREYETECETQEDTSTRITSTNRVSAEASACSPAVQQHNKTTTVANLPTSSRRSVTSQHQAKRTTTTSNVTTRTGGRGTRLHHACCGGADSQDDRDDEDEEDESSNDNEDEEADERLLRCKELLKTLKENQLEMLLTSIESYGADLGSCVLVAERCIQDSSEQEVNNDQQDHCRRYRHTQRNSRHHHPLRHRHSHHFTRHRSRCRHCELPHGFTSGVNEDTDVLDDTSSLEEQHRLPITDTRPSFLLPPAHLLSCQIWRWPDLNHSSELKKLPVCHSAKDPSFVCCNPYHWSRLCKPESPPPPYCLTPAERGAMKREASACGIQSRQPDNRCYGNTTAPLRLPESLTTDGEDRTDSERKEWCTLAYWELSGRVGRLYPVEASIISVFESVHDGDGLCLASLAENHGSSAAVRRTRSKIGLGLMLSQEDDGVWAYNRSGSPIFVNSPTLDDPESRTLLVYRVPPGFCLNIFDRAKSPPVRYTTYSDPPNASGPVDAHSVRISFAKGWGPKYSRQEVTSCPCWLEVLLAPCR
ncbi:mothers against decapentaplegic homolog 6 [Chelonus insularis]|uniref:mothers against decapentaplegic homolog 6 n=1 Tax=Chelonus insularis TaxID=460826 RepID=UPI00158AAFB0|nr:mothers against decapentaplegic homolog 6 [Chelonus insularis]XP_034941204.1 mothers against decapentaplegic homolog 6 [Chelonus insularis]